jgi:hypothetical protein
MPAKRKARKATAKVPRKAQKKKRVFRLDDPEEDIALSVHHYDCSLHPPSKGVRPLAGFKRKHVKQYTLVVHKKDGGFYSDLRPKPWDNPNVDVIFLTQRTRDLWAKYVEPNMPGFAKNRVKKR